MIRLMFSAVVAACVLSACGFQLQGHADYPFKKLYISSTGSREMTALLKRKIEAGTDTKILKDAKEAKDADAVLSITEGRGQATLSLNAEGIVEEYELDLTVAYQLTGRNGTVLIPASNISLNRSMTYNNEFALAKQAEADLLYRDMEHDAVDQLMRRLAVVHTLEPGEEPAVPAINRRAPLPTPPL
ncbi:LPS assembly lipoprotein LptE [Pararobbsia alpina]|uniref:LPS-assembly lipoprotein LptE n=1 Tax=Pararobbsia alpina TaxID=621374 RepID=A0A6S7BZ31_9BURK|nr:LPS assembly lipoprotein LptE [Pararobbsia alpina]CAB3777270.1 LPS-assembly lipoprotein LptE [Pararobbsia alpina]